MNNSTNMQLITATHITYCNSSNSVITTEIDNDFKILYMYLQNMYTQCKRDSILFTNNWSDIFESIGRMYDTKKSKNYIKLLEDCGLLTQHKIPADNNKVKIVYDISDITGLKFVNKGSRSGQKPITQLKQLESVTCHVYVQELTSPFFSCIKFGISSDVNLRMKQQDKDSMFKHKVLMSWDVGNRTNAIQIENYLKGKYETGVAMKEWLPSGYTETIDMGHKDCVIKTIQQMIDNYQELDL